MTRQFLAGAQHDLNIQERLRPTPSDSLDDLQRKRQSIARLLQVNFHQWLDAHHAVATCSQSE